MRVVAIFPMKAESERVPNKNMRLFNGQPLCSVMIEKLQNSKYIEEIVVNTDSKVIRDFVLSSYNNITVIERPQELIGHDVSMNKIIAHDINLVQADLYLQTHSTNPLLKTKTIDLAIEKFKEQESTCDSLFSVTRFQTRFYKEDGVALNHNPEVLMKTQDLPVLYEENSCIYIFNKEAFQKNNRRIGNSPLLFEIQPLEAIDIDVEDEFVLAEKLFQIL